jgi:hypothetical protein
MPVLLNGPYNKDLCIIQSPSHNSLPGSKPGLHLPAAGRRGPHVCVEMALRRGLRLVFVHPIETVTGGPIGVVFGA